MIKYKYGRIVHGDNYKTGNFEFTNNEVVTSLPFWHVRVLYDLRNIEFEIIDNILHISFDKHNVREVFNSIEPNKYGFQPWDAILLSMKEFEDIKVTEDKKPVWVLNEKEFNSIYNVGDIEYGGLYHHEKRVETTKRFLRKPKIQKYNDLVHCEESYHYLKNGTNCLLKDHTKVELFLSKFTIKILN